MVASVKTAITNLNRTPYTLKAGRGKRISIRGGETITLPYDLFSIISRADKIECENAVKRGTLRIDTQVVTSENTIQISPEGSINIQIEKQEEAPKAKPIKLEPAKAEKKDLNGSGGGTIIAGKSAGMAASMGMKTEETAKSDIKEVALKNGKAEPIEEKTSNVFTSTSHNNLPKADGVSVFTEKKEPSEKEQVEGWLNSKDYNMLYAYLTDNHPEEFAATTKTAVKKCKTYEDLRTLLGI